MRLTGIEICLGVPLQSVQLFLPVIINRLGYNTVKVCRPASWAATGNAKG
jgi:hypothetical protein